MPIAIGLLLTAILTTPGWAQSGPPLELRQHNAWARFRPGAWKKVRVVTETLDANGAVTDTSTTETTTYLEQIWENGYSLSTEVTVEVAGKRFEAQPQLVDQGFNGELDGESSLVRQTSTETIDVDDDRVPCQIYQYSIEGEGKQQRNRVYYAANFSPQVLRRESVVTDASGKKTLYTITESVVEVDMPLKVGDKTMSTSHVRTVRTNSKGSTVTLAVHSDAIPGGVINHTSKELDTDGRLVRRSTLQLLDYGLESEEESRPRIFRRRGLFRKRNRGS
jgi:hypothetical protein